MNTSMYFALCPTSTDTYNVRRSYAFPDTVIVRADFILEITTAPERPPIVWFFLMVDAKKRVKYMFNMFMRHKNPKIGKYHAYSLRDKNFASWCPSDKKSGC